MDAKKPETKNAGFPKGSFPLFLFPYMANSVKTFFHASEQY